MKAKRTQFNIAVGKEDKALYARLLKYSRKPLNPSISRIVWLGIALALDQLEKKK